MTVLCHIQMFLVYKLFFVIMYYYSFLFIYFGGFILFLSAGVWLVLIVPFFLIIFLSWTLLFVFVLLMISSYDTVSFVLFLTVGGLNMFLHVFCSKFVHHCVFIFVHCFLIICL